jgi:hypothetical protein
MRRIPYVFCILAVALAAAAVAPRAARADRPELAFQMGRTFAVGSKTSGAFDQGGFLVSAGALWPYEDRFRFGFQIFATDYGNNLAPVILADPSGGPSKVYGTIDSGHRGAFGAAWRADAMGPKLGGFGRSYATATYGYYRNTQDRVGREVGALSSVGGSVGLGLERKLTPHHALGLAASATWMSDDFTRRYGSASLEWRWHW